MGIHIHTYIGVWFDMDHCSLCMIVTTSMSKQFD